MAAHSNPRYVGKPLLRLLECYVLWSIEQLGEQEQRTLQAMTPKLQTIYSVTGEWQKIIEQVMHLEPELPQSIRQLWARNTKIAQQAGTTLSPQHFAEMFVDKNLTPHIS